VDYLFLRTQRHNREWILTWVAGMSVLVADLITLAWVGMWLGLRSRSLHRASAAAVVRVLVLPWMLFGLSITAVGILSEADPALSSMLRSFMTNVGEERVFILAWLALSLLIDLAFTLWARTKLLRYFRAVATHEYGSKKIKAP
jgi:hypothetical protein